MNKIRLIIWREYITRVRKPSFLIMTILGPLLLIGSIFLVAMLAVQESGSQQVLVIDEAGGLVTGQLKGNEKLSFVYAPGQVQDSAFIQGPYTMMLFVPSNVTYGGKIKVTYKQSPSQSVQNNIRKQVEDLVEKAKLAKNNIDPKVYDNIKSPLELLLFDIKDKGKQSHDQEKAAIGFGFGYLIFFFIFLYGVQVMRGVMEEKQNRIVEVLVSSVKPFQLMMGKIVGIAAVGLTQFLLWVALSGILGGIGMAIAKDKFAAFAEVQSQGMVSTELKEQMNEQGVPTDTSQARESMQEAFAIWDELPIGGILLLFVFYFLGGYLLYSSLYAAVGSAVDSESESQQFMMPVTIPMMIGLFVAQLAIVNPDGPAVTWCSIIPFTSPIVMMIRVAMGNAFEHPWHLALSMGLLVGTFLFTTWLAGRIYRTGILMYGKKITWKELGKWLFYKG